MARCLVVLADGLRPDAITMSHAPTLTTLARDYTTAAHAVTVRPSVTVAALASFATGVAPATHGLVEPGLGFLPQLPRLRPLARMLSAHRVPTTVVAGNIGLRDRPVAWALTNCAGVERLINAGRSAAALAHVARGVTRAEEGFVFAYLPDCDRAGHAHGWMSPQYLRAVSAVDAAVGALTPLLDDTLLIVVSDHGGGGRKPTEHDEPHPLNDHITLIVAGAGARRRHGIAGTVSLLDVPPTILHWFNVPVPAGYEGRVLVDALAPPPAALAIA